MSAQSLPDVGVSSEARDHATTTAPDGWNTDDEGEDNELTSEHEADADTDEEHDITTPVPALALPSVAAVIRAFSVAVPLPGAFLASLHSAWCDDCGFSVSDGARQSALQSKVFEDCSTQCIELSGLGLGPRCATTLSSWLLRPDSAVRSLTLNNNRIESFGLTELLKAAVQCDALEHLALRDNGIGPAGVSELAHALVAVPRLRTLDLGSDLEPVSARRRNRADGKSLQQLAAALSVNQTVAALSLRGMSLAHVNACEALAAALRKNVALTAVDLAACDVHSRGAILLMAAAAKQAHIRTLDMSRNRLDGTAAGAAAELVVANPAFEHLILRDNPLTAHFASALAVAMIASTTTQAHALVSLDLGCTALTDECSVQLAAAIEAHPKLTRLKLDGNQFTTVGAARILGAAHRSATLQHLALQNNPIERKSADPHSSQLLASTSTGTSEAKSGWLQALRDLGRNRALLSLDLSGCHLSDASGASLCSGLQSRSATLLLRVRLTDNFFSAMYGTAFLETARACPWLAALDVRGSQIPFDVLQRIQYHCAANRREARESEPRRLRRSIAALQRDEAALKTRANELAHARTVLADIETSSQRRETEAKAFAHLHQHRRAATDAAIEREREKVADARARIDSKARDLCEHENIYEQRLEELKDTLLREKAENARLDAESVRVKDAIDDIVKCRPARVHALKAELSSRRADQSQLLVQLTHLKREAARLKQCQEDGTVPLHLLAFAYQARRWLEHERRGLDSHSPSSR